jgi:uncharacterized protein (TIGR02145 family)
MKFLAVNIPYCRLLNVSAKSVLFLLFFFPLTGFSQGEFNNWFFGMNKSICFNSGVPVLTSGNPMNVGGTTVSVSDSAGSVLFYSDGMHVWDRTNTYMPNGGGLFGTSGSFSQTVAVVKSVSDDSLYYLFTAGRYAPGSPGSEHPAAYSVIDMRLHGRLGDIVAGQKNIPLPGGKHAYQTVTGTRHANNRDAWMMFRLMDNDSNYYAAYRINAAGIDTVPVFSPSMYNDHPLPPFYIEAPNNYLKFSPDGKQLLCIYNLDTIEVCYFNAATGQVTPRFLYRFAGVWLQEMEFSIDSRFLYITAGTNTLMQYDATAKDSLGFALSRTNVAYNGGAGAHSAIQMAPDGKIYGTRDMLDSLYVINYPSVAGAGCGYQRAGFCLQNPSHADGFPQFIQRYKAYIHNSGQCAGDTVNFSGDIWPPPDSIHWDFGDPASGFANTSNLATPFHIYPAGGIYTVTLFVRHNDMRTDSVWRTVTILAGPVVNLGNDRYVCPGDSATFDAGTCAGCLYQWDNVTLGIPNIGPNQTYRTNQPGIYAVTVTGSNGCHGRDTLQLINTPIPAITNTTFLDSICTGDSTHIALFSSVTNTVFHWTASLTSGNVTGFSADSGQVIKQVLVNSLATPGIVTYHVTPKVGTCAGTPVDFQEKVFPGDSVKVSVSASTNNICPGTPVTFTAIPVFGGSSPSFAWKVNGLTAGSNSSVFSYSPVNGDLITCILTSSIPVCVSNNPATSNTITMTVLPAAPVTVSIAVSANPVCQGTQVTFIATAVNPGSAPIYSWKVNGTAVAASGSTYTYIPGNGDCVVCSLMSNATCAAGNPANSNTICITVNPNLPVSVSVAASPNPFCIGNPVAFTATAINGGTAPIFTWKVNGVTAGASSSTYSYIPVTGDVVTCVLMSNEVCAIGNPAISTPITMTGFAGVPAGVTITAAPSPSCPGVLVTFTATPTNGGTTPVYAWKVNGVTAGGNSPTYSYIPVTGDMVTCDMTSSLACVSNNPASSIQYPVSLLPKPLVTFVPCFDTITTTNAKPIKLKGGIPIGGTYSGPGVTANIFNPSLAGSGTKTISYSYTNSALCSSLATVRIFNFQFSIFNCGNNLTDIRDNQSYPTVQIGSQCWMASNLNYGTLIPSNTHQRDNCIVEKYCYNDLTANCGLGTANYQWDELMRYDDTPGLQGLCPPGWHVPTEADWTVLFNYYGGPGFAGAPLLASGFSGFNAEVSGIRHLVSVWDFQNFATFFWSSTAHGSERAWAHGMNNVPDDHSVSWYPAVRSNGFAVRCIKD